MLGSHARDMPYLNYQLLRIYAYYRTVLASLLLMMFAGGFGLQVLGDDFPRLYALVAMAYTAQGILTLIILWRGRFAPSDQLLFLLLMIDISALVILMFASGGIDSGLGFMLIITIAAGSIFFYGQLANFIAATASLGVIIESLVTIYAYDGSFTSLFPAGVLGFLLFVTSQIFQYLTQRIRSSSQEASHQAAQAAHLQQLAQSIVERMRTGIIVADPHDQVLLSNQAARELLRMRQGQGFIESLNLYPSILQGLRRWRIDPEDRKLAYRQPDGGELQVSFASLAPDNSGDALIFLEDIRQVAQQAQQMKLASLGHLTASIAHEIRNPLGAISHAAQLLAEIPELTDADRKFTYIIRKHSDRVNQIIENILQLSRRKATKSETLNLKQWLTQFVSDYHTDLAVAVEIELDFLQDAIEVVVDTSQLSQVLTNLFDNGLRYSYASTGRYHIAVVAGIDGRSEQPFIDVLDDGPGIAEDNREKLFEPFFTTETSGTGLGLYIARELCLANQATLDFVPTPKGQSRFRIQFAHPQRLL